MRVSRLVIRITDNVGHNPTVERVWRTTREKKKNHIYSSQTWRFYLMTITCCLPGPRQMERSVSLYFKQNQFPGSSDTRPTPFVAKDKCIRGSVKGNSYQDLDLPGKPCTCASQQYLWSRFLYKQIWCLAGSSYILPLIIGVKTAVKYPTSFSNKEGSRSSDLIIF